MPNELSRADDRVGNIIEKYSGTVYRLAYAQLRNKADADDIFQEVFLRYIRKQPVFESEEHEKAWMLRVTINCCKNFWSSAFRRYTSPLEEYMASEEMNEDALVLSQCMAQLPENHRVVLHLFYYEDMTTAQMAKVLGRSESTVRVQLTRARRQLETLMKGGESA